MAKLLAAIDYSEAAASAVRALLPLRRTLHDTLILYHAYQIPRGLPFLSAHVIEKIEKDADTTAREKLREFLSSLVPPSERRGIRLLVQRDFPTDGLRRHLATDKYGLLALGAQSSDESEGGLGFHARHFIYHSPIPTLVTFPETELSWKKILIAYDESYTSPKGKQFLRRLISKMACEVVGLPILRQDSRIERLHARLQRLTGAPHYTRILWRGAALVQLLRQAALTYDAEIVALYTAPDEIVEGLKSLPADQLRGAPAWLFLPQPSPPPQEAPDTES